MGTWSTFLATLERHLNSSSCFSTSEAWLTLMNTHFSIWLLWFFMLYLYLWMNWSSRDTLTVNTCFHTLTLKFLEVRRTYRFRNKSCPCCLSEIVLTHDVCAAQVIESGELIEVSLPIFLVCLSIPGHDCGLQASLHIISHQQIYNTLVPYMPMLLILYVISIRWVQLWIIFSLWKINLLRK